MSEVCIRSARADESGALAGLLVRANEEHLSAFPASVASAYRLELSTLPASSRATEVYVAHVDDRLVGSVALVVDAGDDDHPWPRGGSVLRRLAVEPSARGRGVGRRLTQTCIDRARARGSLFLGLHTAPSMVVARRLYEQLAFVRTPEHDFDPASHYAGEAATAAPPWGLAYVLDLAIGGGARAD